MAARQTKREEFLKTKEAFPKIAFIIISEMVKMSNQTIEDTSALVNEVLHSIFFLGETRVPQFTPSMVFDNNEEIYNVLKELHPRPFEVYASQLPRRSPFSCVLDMIVHLTGQADEKAVRKRVTDIKQKLMAETGLQKKILFPSTICISRTNTPDSVRYYGVSMSTFDRPSGQIMVAASCCDPLNDYWDGYVADAVLTYCPDKKKKDYFDGTIQVPADVSCKSYNTSTDDIIDPCRSCKELFGLETDETKVWVFGNCAETESLSKLLKNEKQVKQRTRQPSDTVTDENRTRARQYVRKHLMNLLRSVGFKWDGSFYAPQGAQIIG